jgi:cytochrome b561
MRNAGSADYGPVIKMLHWVIVLLVIVAWTLDIFGEELADEPAHESGLLTHIWIGLAILVIALVRIPWRITNPPPKSLHTEFGRRLIEWTYPVFRLGRGLVSTQPNSD